MASRARQPNALALLSETLASPRQFALLTRIIDKKRQEVPLRYNRIQRHFFEHYSLGKRKIDVIVKPRQVGMTTSIVVECLRLSLTQYMRTTTLIDTDANTAKVRAMLDRAYASLPVFNVAGRLIDKPRRSIANATTSRFDNGSEWAIVTAGAKTGGRASTIDVLHTSETAYFRDAESMVTGAQQAAGEALWIVHESTTNGAQGYFYDIAMQGVDYPEGLYRTHFYPWWWNAAYSIALDRDERLTLEEDELALVAAGATVEQIKWRRSKKRELGRRFDQEYPEDVKTAFVTSGWGYFGDIEHVFTAPLNVTPDKSLTYVAGLDWGQQRDYTALMIFCVETRRMVDFLRMRRESWASMRSEVVRLLRKWDVTIARVEANSMGSSQIEALRDDLYEAKLSTAILRFDMTASSKPLLMSAYRAALIDGGLRLQPIDVVRAELLAARAVRRADGWTVESPRDKQARSDDSSDELGHGDTVVAGALAHLAATGIDSDLRYA